MKKSVLLLFMFLTTSLFSQVGINTDDPSPASVLDVNSTNGVGYGGFLPPRVTIAQRNAIPVTASDDGLMVYLVDGTERCVQIYDAILNVWDNVYCMPVNDKPVATISYTGLTTIGQTLTSSYTYSDTESDPEGTHTYKWFTATDLSGTDEAPIPGATSSTFVVTAAQNGLYIAVQIIPVATSGMSPGNAVMSNYDGPVVANAAPVASNVSISGGFTEYQTLTANYDYSDTESNTEGPTTFQWYYASDASGNGINPIPGATSSTYVLGAGDVGDFIAVEITPVATSGTITGTSVMSAWGGPVTVPSAFASDLFISEYIEGNSSNKAIEIANFTGATVNLLDYKLNQYSNGSSSGTTVITFTSISLPHGSVYVVKNSSASSSLPANATSGSLNFNGDDVIALLNSSNAVIDLIGDIGVDEIYAENKGLRKKLGIGPSGGDGTYSISDYDEITPTDTFTGFGSHTY